MSEQTRQSAPPYSEEQVTRWLAFLARGMTEHDQTVFQIEQLQPTWLSASHRLWIYLLLSRTIWGITVGSSGGIIAGFLTAQFSLGILLGLSLGVIGGIVIGCIDIGRSSQLYGRNVKGYVTIADQIRRASMILGICVAIIMGLSVHPITGIIDGTLLIVSGRLISSTLDGSYRMMGRQWNSQWGEIQTFETFHLSWMYFLRGIPNGFIAGLCIGLSYGQIMQPDDRMRLGVLGGLMGGLLGGLIYSMQPSIRESKLLPNQGIWLTLRNAAAIGMISGILSGLLSGVSYHWSSGITHGVLVGLIFFIWYGGLDVIQHFLVRFLLWRSGSLPWRLAPFLDYAAKELHFLQKVGGGYIFVHRYLLEHFADLTSSSIQLDD